MFDAFYDRVARTIGASLAGAVSPHVAPQVRVNEHPTAEGERAYHHFRQVVARAALVHERKTCLADLKTMLSAMGHSYYFDADEREKLERSRRLTARVVEIDALLEVAL